MAVPGVHVGAGVDEAGGDVVVTPVSGEVEGRAALAVRVAYRFVVGDEDGADGGKRGVADGAAKDALAAGVGKR